MEVFVQVKNTETLKSRPQGKVLRCCAEANNMTTFELITPDRELKWLCDLSRVTQYHRPSASPLVKWDDYAGQRVFVNRN